jgi:acetyltransferase-like isoleucine patch superfamily enzyme
VITTWIKRAVARPLSIGHTVAREFLRYAEQYRLMNNLGHCEPDLKIAYPWDVRVEKYVFIGKDVYIGPNAILLADEGAEIHIGSKVMLGPSVTLIANDHRFDIPDKLIRESGYSHRRGIWIGDDVWIGAGAIVLKGVRIYNGSVVGAGSVVTHNISSGEVWAGNPARKIGDRFATA